MLGRIFLAERFMLIVLSFVYRKISLQSWLNFWWSLVLQPLTCLLKKSRSDTKITHYRKFYVNYFAHLFWICVHHDLSMKGQKRKRVSKSGSGSSTPSKGSAKVLIRCLLTFFSWVWFSLVKAITRARYTVIYFEIWISIRTFMLLSVYVVCKFISLWSFEIINQIFFATGCILVYYRKRLPVTARSK